MEPSSSETSWVSVPNETVESAFSTSPVLPVCDRKAAGDAAFAPLLEEKGDPRKLWQSFSSPFFLKKLWKIVGSNWLQSIWWGDAGNCVVVAERFLKKVLGRRGPLQIFETESMKMFIHQLRLHGFSKMEGDSPVSASPGELRALAAADSAFGKLLFYYNPYLKRYHPHLRSPDIQAAVEAASVEESDPFASAPQEDTLISAPSISTPTEPRAEATPLIGSARTSLSPQLNSHTLVGVQDAASAPSDTSPHPVLPPVPNSPFTPGLGLPTFPFGHPYSAAAQAPWASLLPFWDPWLSMSMLAAAAAVAMPRPPHCQAPACPHCPACTCHPNSAAAGNGVVPQH
uniref:HSF-type DNA-binding domain-containing protein n=1 Tax=Aquila chrysaetos chrysaetos TaxID=223781 RepID=A0A663F3C7_AQUCH